MPSIQNLAEISESEPDFKLVLEPLLKPAIQMQTADLVTPRTYTA